MSFTCPDSRCTRCTRLSDFRRENAITHPSYHNAPVPSFGSLDAAILIVGLAPGMHGANATGRPFTGDYAGDVLYPALLKAGLARGTYKQRPDDGMELVNCRITNAVRCLPPQNKPETSEIRQCNSFLREEITAMPNLTTILALGTIAHKAILTALGYKQSQYTFTHGAMHQLEGNITLANSYHTSRYNINTNRLTVAMFELVINRLQTLALSAQATIS